MKRTKNYGMMAEFDSVNALVDAANRTRRSRLQKD